MIHTNDETNILVNIVSALLILAWLLIGRRYLDK